MRKKILLALVLSAFICSCSKSDYQPAFPRDDGKEIVLVKLYQSFKKGAAKYRPNHPYLDAVYHYEKGQLIEKEFWLGARPNTFYILGGTWYAHGDYTSEECEEKVTYPFKIESDIEIYYYIS